MWLWTTYPELPTSSTVAGGLQFEQLGIAAACGQQLIMRASRLDLSVRQHQDAVGHAHAGKSVRNQHRGAAGTEFLEALENLELGARIQRRGRFVEDQHLCVTHIGAGNRHFLPFTAGQVDAVLEPLTDDLVVAFGKFRDDLVGQRTLRRDDDALAVGACLDAADGDVLGGGEVVADEVLEDHPNVVA